MILRLFVLYVFYQLIYVWLDSAPSFAVRLGWRPVAYAYAENRLPLTLLRNCGPLLSDSRRSDGAQKLTFVMS